MDDSSAGSTGRVRVALVGCSGLLGDIIGTTVSSQPDLEVVADLPAPDSADALPAIDADVVVWNGAEEAQPAQWLSGFGRRTCPRVLATVYDGREAWLWQLVPRRAELGALSPTTLTEVIRDLPAVGGGLA